MSYQHNRGWRKWNAPMLLVGKPHFKIKLWMLVQARARILSEVLFIQSYLFVTSWTVARQAPLSMGFSRQEYWSGLPFPFPGDLPDSRIEPGSPALPADSLLSEPPEKPRILYRPKLKPSKAFFGRVTTFGHDDVLQLSDNSPQQQP